MSKPSVSQQIRERLEAFTRHLESGRPIAERFRVTRLVRQRDGTVKQIRARRQRK